jgi:hypothetical protein
MKKKETKNSLEGWFKAIKVSGEQHGEQRAKERKEKADMMRKLFSFPCCQTKPGHKSGDNHYIIWIGDTPHLTSNAPRRVLKNDRILAHIWDEWQNRLTWHGRFDELCKRLK